MARYSEAQKKAVAKYKAAKYKRIPLDVPIEFFERAREAAETAGESLNGYIKTAVDMRMNGTTPPAPDMMNIPEETTGQMEIPDAAPDDEPFVEEVTYEQAEDAP